MTLISLWGLGGPGFAARLDTPSGKPVPRFVSLKFDEVNGREGPSLDHPILWVYHQKGLPLQVVAETPDWRKVRDPEGALTWMHARTLSDRPTVVVASEGPVALKTRARTEAGVLALVDPGVVFELDRCEAAWCRVEGRAASGWIAANALWGIPDSER